MVACSGGHSSVVQLLIDAGADVNGQDDTGATPLFLASHAGHIVVVQLLLAVPGIKINTQNMNG
jgi:ankyrin repeat protein